MRMVGMRIRLKDDLLHFENTRDFILHGSVNGYDGRANKARVKELFQQKCDEYFWRQLTVLRDLERPLINVATEQERKTGRKKPTLLKQMRKKQNVVGGYTLHDHVEDVPYMLKEAVWKGYSTSRIRGDYENGGFIIFSGNEFRLGEKYESIEKPKEDSEIKQHPPERKRHPKLNYIPVLYPSEHDNK